MKVEPWANNLSMKQGSLFCSFCQVEIFQTTPASRRTLGIVGKLLMSRRGAPTVLGGVEDIIIDY
jgi:hypothetical protein